MLWEVTDGWLEEVVAVWMGGWRRLWLCGCVVVAVWLGGCECVAGWLWMGGWLEKVVDGWLEEEVDERP